MIGGVSKDTLIKKVQKLDNPHYDLPQTWPELEFNVCYS